ncbi:RluA family pseudouridine synthase [Nitrincola tapanii]|uniref:RluA family pseudouridine synthase n=1 Tax=Nitrincola tapanii TaxID=1708751 RepID=A0A5A9W254_9GAMM|nr:RluA family pseudouridine synthase [Nitrincola tapanii]KAA0874188.1 RluA family pseudouridine synthase [Nitrincola tapanii]
MSLKLCFTLTSEEAASRAADLLSQKSQLPKARIKDAMNKGAVWLKRKQRKRLRRAQEVLLAGDQLELFYDAELLSRSLPEGIYALEQNAELSVWYKPAGVMAQGNEYGDHLSLLRWVEQQSSRPCFLVHRLDRETRGLMLIAHTGAMAAELSRMFQQKQIEKRYLARVRGETPLSGEISQPLDGKAALTRYTRLAFDPEAQISELEIELETGRTHQIRRHLEAIGHPIMGDPRYGKDNKNRSGLQLMAVSLAFKHPKRSHKFVFDCRSEWTHLAKEKAVVS